MLSTISDNRYEHGLPDDNGVYGDSIKVFAPAVPTSYDYYPFGMLMPGRYMAADTTVERIDILKAAYGPSGPIVSGPVPVGGTSTTTTTGTIGHASFALLPDEGLSIEADTIGAGIELDISVNPGEYNELELNTTMLLGDGMRASVYEKVRDKFQVLHVREIASTLLTMEGNFLMDFVPSGSNVTLKIVYNDAGYAGTTSASAGAGGAGTGPGGTAGKGYSSVKISKIIDATQPEVSHYYYGKIVKNYKDLYRFGFDGMEKVNQIFGRGTHYDFGARYYDARVGRWFSTDPSEARYPWLSTYNGFENNPIYFKDKDGKDAEYTIKGNEIIVTSTIRLIQGDEVAAKNLQNQIRKVWGNKNEFKGKDGKSYTIKFNVNVIVEQNIFTMFSNGYKPSDNIAVVINDEKYRDNVVTGKYINFSKNTKAGAHEYGHTIGLADQYFDVYTRKEFGVGGKKEDYNLSGQNYNGVSQYDIMGVAGNDGSGKVTSQEIENIGNYILDDAKDKKENSKGEKSGVITIRDPDLGEVSNETKIQSGYEPPPISVSEESVH